MIKSYIEDNNLNVDTISDIYEAANWAERETYDQYGINFIGHPNMKRLLNHHQFVGHPLRKDYKITDADLINNKFVLLQRGKKNYFVLTVK